MRYYLHDTNAINDERVYELYLNFGYEGVGLFYVALEKIAQQEQPIKTKILKKQLNIGKRLEKCWSFMESLGILSSNNGETFNERILKFSKKYQIKKEKNRKRVANFREKQEDVMRTKRVRNARKVNKSKIKINNNILQSDQVANIDMDNQVANKGESRNDHPINKGGHENAKGGSSDDNKEEPLKKNHILQSDDCEFNYQIKKKKMFEDKDVRMWIIASYWTFKNIKAENKDQYEAQLKRELRPAGELKGFDKKRIYEVMKWLNENADFKWTLETVLKYIDEDFNKNKNLNSNLYG